MNKKIDWQELHIEMTALNRDIQMMSETVTMRIKHIRQMLQSMPQMPKCVEPEMVEVLRQLMSVIETNFKTENLSCESVAAQNITSLISIKDLQMVELQSGNMDESSEKKKEMPPEILY